MDGCGGIILVPVGVGAPPWPTTIAPADACAIPGGGGAEELALVFPPLLASSSFSRFARLNMSFSDDSGPAMSVNRSRMSESPRLWGEMT